MDRYHTKAEEPRDPERVWVTNQGTIWTITEYGGRREKRWFVSRISRACPSEAQRATGLAPER